MGVSMTTKKCEFCGKTFETPTYRLKQGKSRFCSHDCANLERSKSSVDMFWERVEQPSADACWEWQGACSSDGYGRLRVGGKDWTAHRLAWTLEIGPIPNERCVLHHCDNPRCVNPAHLFLGTRIDNNLDCKAKGRLAIGAKHGSSKLTADNVCEMRLRHSLGESMRSLAFEFGVHPDTAGQAIKGETWKDVACG